MGSLIKNELIKIFSRKAIYIVIIIAFIVAIIGSLLNKFVIEPFSSEMLGQDMMYSDAYIDEMIDSEKAEIKELDKNSPEERERYIQTSADVKKLELMKEFNGEDDSWKRRIITEEGEQIIREKVENEDTEKAETYNKKYDEFVERIKSSDWKEYAQRKINDIDNQIAILKAAGTSESSDEIRALEITKQAWKWRIDKDIPISASKQSQLISAWENAKLWAEKYENMTDKEKNKLSHEDKFSFEGDVSRVHLIEDYIIKKHSDDKELDVQHVTNNFYVATTDLNMSVINSFDDMFVLIIAIMFAATIVSIEFNKGTIKTLLVRPYTRTKILLAKFITSVIMILFAFVVVALIQAIVGGFVYGFDNFRSNVAIYSFTANKVQVMSYFGYMLLTAFAVFPKYLLLSTFAFAVSTITVSSPLALTLSFLGFSASSVINTLAINVKKAWMLKFFVTPNWDFREFLFGKLPEFKEISLPFSLIMCLLYFIVVIGVAFEFFKRRDIKNV